MNTQEYIEENIYSSVVNLCGEMKIAASDLLTPDILSHTELMRSLSNIAPSSSNYHKCKKEWIKQSSFVKKNSKIQINVDKADNFFMELRKSLIEISNIKIISNNLSVQLKSCQDKLTKILNIIPVLFNTKKALDNAIPYLQSALRAQKQRKFNKLKSGNEYNLLCSNTLGLSWDTALENMKELALNYSKTGGGSCNNVNFYPLNLEQLETFPNLKDKCHHEGLNCIPGYIIAIEYNVPVGDVFQLKAIVHQLLEHFPLLCVNKNKHFVLLDYTEIIFNPGIISQVLTLDQENSDEHNIQGVKDTHSEAREGIMFFNKPGPVPTQQKYPELLTTMMSFIKLHGFAAHARRRTGTSTSCGVRLQDIKNHLIENVEGLTTISKTKVYYLLKPARSNTIEAARHKDALDFRVGVKANDVSKDNINAHEYFANVGFVRQMCAEYPNECTIFSCDSKAKVHIGGQAVSRYHQIRTFFPSDDTPHYMDHDFPVPGYLIEPDGYFQLVSKHTTIVVTKDKLDREIIDVPYSGPLFIYNRGVKNTSTSILDHLNDLADVILKNPSMDKPVLALVTDGGPDWSPKFNLNQFFLGRFWKENNLDMIICCCYAPGLSRYNPIEHKWSPCSKWLAGVSIPACLPGESMPPAKQSLGTEDKLKKENEVFDNALDIIQCYWNGKVHDDFKVTSVPVKSDTVPMNTAYSDVKNMLGNSLRSIKSNPIQMKLLE